ncbi:YdeI/OmpD-associated family protein [Ornithinimicrobium murale]|uniref:YdeI/OmpD-associated family protein n=1 Tax=Ornithinimicrobium murale TaxID=1050153 RepID=UPI000E0D335B|nr:YdeI/OmpD-associated family protein [Ornithinimicrobium murale]
MTIAFETQAQRIGDRLIVSLPDEASAHLPSRGQVAVDADLNGHSFTTVLEPDGRKGHWVAVDDQLEQALALQDGTAVSGQLTPTKAWPEPELPEDLSAALDAAPDIAEEWADITPMARWEWVRWVRATRSPGTRERRVEVTISKLRDGKRRPCCFDLASCTDPELSRGGKLIDAG